MGVEAARLALRPVPAAAPGAIWFATASPAYLDKTNATVLHASLALASLPLVATPAASAAG